MGIKIMKVGTTRKEQNEYYEREIRKKISQKRAILVKSYKEILHDLRNNQALGRPVDYNIYMNQEYSTILQFKI